MPVEIRETTVTPDASGQVVRLHISDAPPLDASAQIIVQISVRLPHYDLPLMAQVQREALVMAQHEISTLLQLLAQEFQAAGHGLRPTLKP